MPPIHFCRLASVTLDSGVDEFGAIPDSERVLSVELCQCPPGYHGSSCEGCNVGYYRQSKGPFGPICAECNCHGHADVSYI